jgi:N-acetyl sugar amidotransferase
MDESAPDLALDEQGLCRYCRDFDRQQAQPGQDPESLRRAGDAWVAKLKAAGRLRRYDCVMGLSGGADSSYALLLAKRLGLRPLAVHVDNGWNSELAVMNIENLVRKLDVDLHTVVIRWNEFRELQLAFLRAGVVDLEMPSDHVIIAGIVQTAFRYLIRYVVSGDNTATEVTLPPTWNHRKTDRRNLRAIHDAFTNESLSSVPQLSTLGMLFAQRVLRQEWFRILSHYPYVKAAAIEELRREIGWRPYPGKHGESIITRFYQGFILARKFGIDKRRIHLSRLICTGQTTREAALAELEAPPYDPELIQIDREFVIKKFGITEREFDELMRSPPHAHVEYASEEQYLPYVFALNRSVRSLISRVRS